MPSRNRAFRRGVPKAGFVWTMTAGITLFRRALELPGVSARRRIRRGRRSPRIPDVFGCNREGSTLLLQYVVWDGNAVPFSAMEIRHPTTG